jgi:hypothetical protein
MVMQRESKGSISVADTWSAKFVIRIARVAAAAAAAAAAGERNCKAGLVN